MRKFILLSIFISIGYLIACNFNEVGDSTDSILRIDHNFLRMRLQGKNLKVFYMGWGFPRSLEVNSYDDECQPWVSGNGKRLFFVTINYNGPPRPGYVGSWDIYFCEWDSINQTWGPPISAGTTVNTSSGERRPTTTFDGDTMFFSRGGDIYVTVWNGNSWAQPIRLSFPVNTDSFAESNPALSFDGERLYFDSNRPGGFGGMDIWVAINRNGFTFDTVINVGPNVNTPNIETRPFESADGQRLYFSNFGGEPREEGSYGASDIYVAHRIGPDWDDWGNVEVVSAPINSDLIACTVYETPDSQKIYIGSEACEGSRGEEDIWIAEKISTRKFSIPDMNEGWTNTGDLPGAIFVYDLKEGPPGVIYAATACEDPEPVGKIFKTFDGGETWIETAPLPGAMAVYSLALRGDTIYAGTYPNGDIFKSVDGGNSWFNTAEIEGARSVRKVLLLPNGYVLAGVSEYDTLRSNKIYRSIDGGDSWEEVNFHDTTSSSAFKFMYLTSTGYIYAGGWCEGMQTKIWRSSDYGENWEPIVLANFSPLSSIDGFFEDMDGNLYAMGWLHPYGQVKGGYIFKSETGGITWDTTAKIVRGDVISIRIYTMTQDLNGTIYVGFQPGPDSVVYASDDGGESWYSTGPLPGAFEVLCLLYASDGYIYAGTTPNGDVFKYYPTIVKEGFSKGGIKLTYSYPNPFISSTKIYYRVESIGKVTLKIYDVSGREVITLVEKSKTPGIHHIVWRGLDRWGRRVNSGVYFYQLKFNDDLYAVSKILFLR
jgi:photosystem II stability/assembly factor-like uncharacterized protein